LRALLDLAQHADFSAVSLDDRLDQAEAQAQATLRTALVSAIQTGPDFVLLLMRNADAGVAENRNCFVVFALDFYGDAASFGRVFDRIIQKVGKDLAHPRPID